jgi:hypothetical protein
MSQYFIMQFYIFSVLVGFYDTSLSSRQEMLLMTFFQIGPETRLTGNVQG